MWGSESSMLGHSIIRMFEVQYLGIHSKTITNPSIKYNLLKSKKTRIQTMFWALNIILTPKIPNLRVTNRIQPNTFQINCVMWCRKSKTMHWTSWSWNVAQWVRNSIKVHRKSKKVQYKKLVKSKYCKNCLIFSS